jgi:hypothetical protein
MDNTVFVAAVLSGLVGAAVTYAVMDEDDKKKANADKKYSQAVVPSVGQITGSLMTSDDFAARINKESNETIALEKAAFYNRRYPGGASSNRQDVEESMAALGVMDKDGLQTMESYTSTDAPVDTGFTVPNPNITEHYINDARMTGYPDGDHATAAFIAGNMPIEQYLANYNKASLSSAPVREPDTIELNSSVGYQRLGSPNAQPLAKDYSVTDGQEPYKGYNQETVVGGVGESGFAPALHATTTSSMASGDAVDASASIRDPSNYMQASIQGAVLDTGLNGNGGLEYVSLQELESNPYPDRDHLMAKMDWLSSNPKYSGIYDPARYTWGVSAEDNSAWRETSPSDLNVENYTRRYFDSCSVKPYSTSKQE